MSINIMLLLNRVSKLTKKTYQVIHTWNVSKQAIASAMALVFNRDYSDTTFNKSLVFYSPHKRCIITVSMTITNNARYWLVLRNHRGRKQTQTSFIYPILFIKNYVRVKILPTVKTIITLLFKFFPQFTSCSGIIIYTKQKSG